MFMICKIQPSKNFSVTITLHLTFAIDQHLENQVKTLEETKSSLMSQLQGSEEECESLQARLEALEQDKHQSEESLQLQIKNAQDQLASLKDEMTTTEMRRKNEIDGLKVGFLLNKWMEIC